MTDTLHFIRPGHREHLRWVAPEGDTEAVRVLLEEMVGLTKVDADAWRVHVKTFGGAIETHGTPYESEPRFGLHSGPDVKAELATH